MRIDVYHHDETAVLRLLEELKELVITNQQKLDAIAAALDTLSAQLTTATTGITADIAALKAANPTLDFTVLDQRVAAITAAAQALSDLDAMNPPAP